MEDMVRGCERGGMLTQHAPGGTRKVSASAGMRVGARYCALFWYVGHSWCITYDVTYDGNFCWDAEVGWVCH
jgi:hypothetical protein